MDSRKKAFTEFEKKLLLNLIEQHAHIVENKKIDSVTVQHKKAAWLQIAHEFNSCSRIECEANPKQLKKYWSNIKTRAREAKAQENQRYYTEVPSIKVQDSNIVLNGTDDDDYNFWLQHKNHDEEGDKEEDPIEEKVCVEVASGNIISPISSVDVKPEAIIHYNPPTLTPTVNHRRKNSGNAFESLKKKIMEQDLMQNKKKFMMEMKHLKRMHDMEIEHKEAMFQLHKEEMQLKIDILKKQLSYENKDVE